MSSESGSDEAILYLHKEGELTDEAYDDTKLVEAYDKAMYQAKQQILYNIQNELSLTEKDIQDVLGDSPKHKKGKNKKKENTDNKSIWQVGSICRVLYSEDGVEYEAQIIKIIDEKWCRVKFIGYGNEEDVLLSGLAPSLGKNVIQLQIATANCYNASLEDVNSEEKISNDEPSDESVGEASEVNFPEARKQIHPRRIPMMDPKYTLPPAPPRLPGSFQIPGNAGMRGHFASMPRSEDDTLNAMLQAWYMCGYYTGYYCRKVEDHHK